jgi:hypothetical protein
MSGAYIATDGAALEIRRNKVCAYLVFLGPETHSRVLEDIGAFLADGGTGE